jgi:hypothetical protein
MFDIDEPRPKDLYTYIFEQVGTRKVYIAGTGGRVEIKLAKRIVEMLNADYSLCVGEGK